MRRASGRRYRPDLRGGALSRPHHDFHEDEQLQMTVHSYYSGSLQRGLWLHLPAPEVLGRANGRRNRPDLRCSCCSPDPTPTAMKMNNFKCLYPAAVSGLCGASDTCSAGFCPHLLAPAVLGRASGRRNRPDLRGSGRYSDPTTAI